MEDQRADLGLPELLELGRERVHVRRRRAEVERAHAPSDEPDAASADPRTPIRRRTVVRLDEVVHEHRVLEPPRAVPLHQLLVGRRFQRIELFASERRREGIFALVERDDADAHRWGHRQYFLVRI